MADELASQLNAVLSNPDAMGQIMSIARSLTGEGGGGTGSAEPSEENQEYHEIPALAQPQSAAAPDLAGIINMLGGLTGGGQGTGESGNPLSALAGLDPRILQLGMRLFSEYGREDDRKTALLMALKPFLKEDRAAKIDRAAQAAKLSRVVRAALQIFKEGGMGTDV